MLKNSPVTVTLPAVDIERAKKFYTEILGLQAKEGIEANSASFEAGKGTHIYMYQRAATKADHTAAAFEVSDIEATVKELRGKGVRFEEYDMPGIKTVDGIATMGNTKSAWFKDTEGNVLAISSK